MHVVTVSEPGDPTRENEDWLQATTDLMVMLDGATARTETGCQHGIAWYVTKLGSQITSWATELNFSLVNVLQMAINDTKLQHMDCDLEHPATPSAAVAIARRKDDAIEYLVLGDVTLVLDCVTGVQTVTDDRVDQTAHAERLEAARLPFGTPEKQQALLRMKEAELAARNKDGGYWTASTWPEAAKHAITGSVHVADLRSLTMLTDGAARAVALFELMNWSSMLDLVSDKGPSHIIQLVREAEASDATGSRWPRNKRCDDASVAHIRWR